MATLLVRTSFSLGFTGSSLLQRGVRSVVNLGAVVKTLRRGHSLSRSVLVLLGPLQF